MNFLVFDSFISIPVLIGFYYLGAIVCPVVMWHCMRWLLRGYPLIQSLHTQGKEIVWKELPTDKKWKILILFIMMFMLAEIFWRMMFEFLIAYMQMHDALVH